MSTLAKQAGFTLVELLVVLVIIALLSGVTVLTIGQRDSQAFASEVSRLALLIQQASDRALMKQEVLGLVVEDQSYYFSELNGTPAAWQPIEQGHWALHTLPENIELSLEAEQYSGAAFSDTRDIEIVFLPSGQYTAFRAELRSSQSSRRLIGDGYSAVQSQSNAAATQ